MFPISQLKGATYKPHLENKCTENSGIAVEMVQETIKCM